jgi:3-carboxy-cis,cis-muconate cycloisomerase
MAHEHERGLGGWQAELAEWPALFLATHGSLVALADASAGLLVDPARMRANIERQRGTVFAEAAAALLAPTRGKAEAQALLARLSARAIADDIDLRTLLRAEPALAAIDAGAIDAVFDIDAAARAAGVLAAAQLDRLARRAATEIADEH